MESLMEGFQSHAIQCEKEHYVSLTKKNLAELIQFLDLSKTQSAHLIDSL
jgi:hypothetical protein